MTLQESYTNELLVENENHGKIFLTELSLIEPCMRDLADFQKSLPAGIIGDEDLKKIVGKQLKKEKISGIELTLHGQQVNYEKTLDESGRVIRLCRWQGNSSMPLANVQTHYHITSLEHSGFKTTVTLGASIKDFEAAFKALRGEAELYVGESELTPLQLRYRPQPSDLSRKLFEAFLAGFKYSAENLQRKDIIAGLEGVLEYLQQSPPDQNI